MVKSRDNGQGRLLSFVEDLQARGRYTFTRAEVAKNGERSDVAFKAALRRLKRKGRITSPRRRFYVLVPLEYREAGSPPASWFIDDLMRFLGQPYYVGLLTAAAIHGAYLVQASSGCGVWLPLAVRSRPLTAGRQSATVVVEEL